MTRTEALRILVRYMPERSIHITESLDSNIYQGDRTDKETAFVTVSPGITQPAAQCFSAPNVHLAVMRVMNAAGQDIPRLLPESRFETDQRRAFETLNA